MFYIEQVKIHIKYYEIIYYKTELTWDEIMPILSFIGVTLFFFKGVLQSKLCKNNIIGMLVIYCENFEQKSNSFPTVEIHQ